MNNESKLQINLLSDIIKLCKNEKLKVIYREEYLSKLSEILPNVKVQRCKKCFNLFENDNFKILRFYGKSGKLKVVCKKCNKVSIAMIELK